MHNFVTFFLQIISHHCCSVLFSTFHIVLVHDQPIFNVCTAVIIKSYIFFYEKKHTKIFFTFSLIRMASECPADNCCKDSVQVSKKKVITRRLGANQIPDSILNNDVLNDAIAKLLPSNYNFELHKTIFKVRFAKLSQRNK